MVILKNRMKILITGSNGFIGSKVLENLISLGHFPTILYRDNSFEDFIPSRCSKLNIDIGESGNNIYDDTGRPDLLIHLAWGGLPNYNESFHLDLEYRKQKLFLERMIKGGLKNLFITGTCFEYGKYENAIHPNVELKPVTVYGKAKVKLFHKLNKLKKKYSFSLTWARLFYIYGEGQSKNTLFGQLEEAVKNKQKKFNMSSGEQLRDYMRVTDVAEQINNIALSLKDFGAINICSGKPIKVKELVAQVCSENNWKIDLNLGYYEISKNEPKNFWGIPFKKKLGK